MPIYQYKCADCDHQLEAIQRMSDAKLVDCPQCNAPALRKQLTAAAFKLKGTGWYETDFKNSGSKPKISEPGSASKNDSTPEASKSKSESTDTASTNA